jgi:hypothetical protein
MLDDGARRRLQTTYRTLQVTYAGMLSSLGVYWVVVMLIRKVGAIPASRSSYDETEWLRYPLYALGAGLFGLVLVLRQYLLSPHRVRERATGSDAPAYLNAIFAVHVIVFALAEIPAVLGLALYFLGGFLTDFYAMAAFSLGAFAAVFPRRSQGATILEALLAAPAPLRPRLENS